MVSIALRFLFGFVYTLLCFARTEERALYTVSLVLVCAFIFLIMVLLLII